MAGVVGVIEFGKHLEFECCVFFHVIYGLDVEVNHILESLFFSLEDYVGLDVVGPASALDKVVEEDGVCVVVVLVVLSHVILKWIEKWWVVYCAFSVLPV